MPQRPKPKLNITFLTGTRAEFGLMAPTLRAIQRHPKLSLSLLATGMHLDPAHGNSLQQIQRQGFKVNATIPWPTSPPIPQSAIRNPQSPTLAIHTGFAISGIAQQLDRLNTDVLLVVGDRVEAFAGATAAHLSHRTLAHVHGGDRALGQIDDSLRHAITKLAHIHFPATQQSANRIKKLGEHPSRIHLVGSPGLDNIHKLACPPSTLKKRFNLKPNQYALLVLHPADPDDALEEQRAHLVLTAALERFQKIVIIYPNNDPGSAGIIRAWKQSAIRNPQSAIFLPDAPRPLFLALLRDASLLLGNSSSGIIEAASFQTPVLDIGPRQLGRERSPNVRHADYTLPSLRKHLKVKDFVRKNVENVYGNGTAATQIARVLSSLDKSFDLQKKLITY